MNENKSCVNISAKILSLLWIMFTLFQTLCHSFFYRGMLERNLKN